MSVFTRRSQRRIAKKDRKEGSQRRIAKKIPVGITRFLLTIFDCGSERKRADLVVSSSKLVVSSSK
jgi:hypothetical protein